MLWLVLPKESNSLEKREGESLNYHRAQGNLLIKLIVLMVQCKIVYITNIKVHVLVPWCMGDSRVHFWHMKVLLRFLWCCGYCTYTTSWLHRAVPIHSSKPREKSVRSCVSTVNTAELCIRGAANVTPLAQVKDQSFPWFLGSCCFVIETFLGWSYFLFLGVLFIL